MKWSRILGFCLAVCILSCSLLDCAFAFGQNHPTCLAPKSRYSGKTTGPSVSARLFIKEMLQSPVRPEILEVWHRMQTGMLTEDQVFQAALEMQENPPAEEYRNFVPTDVASGQEYMRKYMPKTIRELDSILLYTDQMFDQILKEFPNHKLLFCGRDAEALYDAFKMRSLYQPNGVDARLLPASLALWRNSLDFTEDMQRKFFERYNITRETIDRGDRFLLFDTGFQGTVGYQIRAEVAELLGYQGAPDPVLQRAFPMRLVSLIYPKDGTVKQLMDFSRPLGVTEEQLAGMFPRTLPAMRDYDEVLQAPLANLIARAMQRLPHFHPPYNTLIEYKSEVIATSVGLEKRYAQAMMADKFKFGTGDSRIINPEYFNHPVVALLLQMHTARRLHEKWEKHASVERPAGALKLMDAAL